MARKKVEEMSFDELLELSVWYDSRLRYVRWLMQDKFGGHS